MMSSYYGNNKVHKIEPVCPVNNSRKEFNFNNKRKRKGNNGNHEFENMLKIEINKIK